MTLRNAVAASLALIILSFSSSPAWSESSDVHCIVTARGELFSGETFLGHATIRTDFTVSPGGFWRHFEKDGSGTPVEVMAGRVEEGICVRNGRTNVVFGGVGRFRGQPAEFLVNAWDGATDSYTISVRDSAEAKSHLQTGLALAPDDAFNLNICGGAVSYLGDYDKCTQLCNQALELDPNFADAYFNLALAYYNTGKFKEAHEAHEALDRVEQMAPNDAMCRYYDWYRANLLAWEERYEEAEPLTRAAIDKAPSYNSPYLLLAGILAEMGRRAEAKEALIQALTINPRLSLDRYAKRHPNQQIRVPRRRHIARLRPAQ